LDVNERQKHLRKKSGNRFARWSDKNVWHNIFEDADFEKCIWIVRWCERTSMPMVLPKKGEQALGGA
jgi:hypothetical protein